MEEKLIYEKHNIFTPDMVKNMTPEKLMPYAIQASKYIEELGKGKMFQYSPYELLAFMQHEMAMFSTDKMGKLSGFVKVDPWVNYPNGEPDDDGLHGSHIVLSHIDGGLAEIVGLETGSLVVNPEYQHQDYQLGTFLKKSLTEYTYAKYSDIPIFAVVAKAKDGLPTPAFKLNAYLGWTPITPEDSLRMIGIDVLNVPGWDPSIPVDIFVYPPTLKPGK